MARMIPAVISPEVKSNAEKHVFKWFKEDPLTKDWIVLHSLGIVNHKTVIYGEIDFVVLAPNLGIFALEVKGGRVKRHEGFWSFQDKYDNITKKERGPFEQAKDGIFSLVSWLKGKIKEDNQKNSIANVFYGYGVMFPDIEYSTVGCDEEQWQVFDVNDGIHVGEFVHRLFEGAKKRWIQSYGFDIPKDRIPTKNDIDFIFNLLRGDFDKVVPLNIQVQYSEEALLKLTEEQYRCLDQFEDNKRCLIIGGAGTGKTLLAIEEAKRASADGLQVALFCFNNTLGDWFKKHFDSALECLRPSYVGTIHSFLINEIKKTDIETHHPRKKEDIEKYYCETVPMLGVNAILSNNTRFDMIVVDEAQDLLNEYFIDVFDALLYGGLSRGAWTMYGDFSNQAIYNESCTADDMFELLDKKAVYSRFKLVTNCRNTRNICKEMSIVSGVKIPQKMLNNVDGPRVQFLRYSNKEQQKEKLISCLNELLNNGIKESDITILSPYAKEKSIVANVNEITIQKYKPYGNKHISFSSIQAFKGLESSVIILTDIDSFSDSKLMYVALSRARNILYILESYDARTEYLELVERGLKWIQEETK